MPDPIWVQRWACCCSASRACSASPSRRPLAFIRAVSGAISMLPDNGDGMPDVKRAARFISAHLDDAMTIAVQWGVCHLGRFSV